MYPTCVLLSCLRDSGGIGLGMEIQLPGLVVLSICGTVVGQNTSDPCSRAESQPQPVLRQKQHGQQVNPGYCPTLLHTGETLSGALYPALGLPAQEGFGPVGASPEEDHSDQRAGCDSVIESFPSDQIAGYTTIKSHIFCVGSFG